MSDDMTHRRPENGDRIAAADIPRAITAGELVYDDGSTQVFQPDGHTTYMEHGRPTEGEWWVDDQGRFWSFWPPSYRADYDLEWVVEEGNEAGVVFRDARSGSASVGRYRSRQTDER